MTKAQDLHDAILSNSASVVRELLETGADPSISPRLPLLANIRKQDTIPKKFWFARHVSATTITPLFMAVMSCYNNARTIHDDDGPANARTILELLIGAGTNVQHVAIDLVACNIEGFYSLGIDEPCTAKKFALFLKQHLNQVYSREQGKFLDEVIEKLQTAERDAGNLKPKMVRVPATALETWKALLFSSKFSDVRFVCEEDECVLHAHKAVLAASSTYFSALFEGPWAENHADGEIATSNPSHIMKAVLSYIYTGSIDEALLEEHAEELVGVATEYGLADLRKQSECACIRSLAVANVKRFLQLADLHEAQDLKLACFTFVQRHAATVLTDPDMMGLATEEPGLWAELAAKISSDGGKKRLKRARDL